MQPLRTRRFFARIPSARAITSRLRRSISLHARGSLCNSQSNPRSNVPTTFGWKLDWMLQVPCAIAPKTDTTFLPCRDDSFSLL